LPRFILFLFLKKRLPGVGSKPGSSRFYLFSHFHHFTVEPQRLPIYFIPFTFPESKYPKRVNVAMVVWSSGIVYACGVLGREIESRRGIRRLLFIEKKLNQALCEAEVYLYLK
jgi:hypothetical protein